MNLLYKLAERSLRTARIAYEEAALAALAVAYDEDGDLRVALLAQGARWARELRMRVTLVNGLRAQIGTEGPPREVGKDARFLDAAAEILVQAWARGQGHPHIVEANLLVFGQGENIQASESLGQLTQALDMMKQQLPFLVACRAATGFLVILVNQLGQLIPMAPFRAGPGFKLAQVYPPPGNEFFRTVWGKAEQLRAKAAAA